jgi:hypothetical protein
MPGDYLIIETLITLCTMVVVRCVLGILVIVRIMHWCKGGGEEYCAWAMGKQCVGLARVKLSSHGKHWVIFRCGGIRYLSAGPTYSNPEGNEGSQSNSYA